MKKFLTFITGFATTATIAFAQQAIPSVQPVQASPNASQYQYNAQDGYYYNAKAPENRLTVRDARTGFYISVGMAGAGDLNNSQYENNSLGINQSDDRSGIDFAPFAKVGYIIPGLFSGLPQGPNLALEFDFSYFNTYTAQFQGIRQNTDNFTFSPVALLSFNAAENRVRYWLGAGPSFNLQYLNSPRQINGLDVNADSSKAGFGILAKIGMEYFFLPHWAVMGEYAFMWYPETSYSYSLGANTGTLKITDLMSNQIRLGISYHF